MEPQTTTIRGTTFMVQKIDVGVGWPILAKASGALGAALRALGSQTMSLKGAPVSAMGAVVQSAAASLVGEYATAKTLLEGASVRNSGGVFVPLDVDTYFVAKYDLLIELLQFSLEVNFGSFFVMLASARAALATETQAPSPSTSPIP